MKKNIIEKRISIEKTLSESQIGFMPRKLTVKPLFCVKNLVDNYQEKDKKL